MVAVVHAHRENRHRGIEFEALDVGMNKFEILVVFGRQKHQAAHVVEHQLDLHPFVRFFQQQLPKGIPHLSARDDKVLGKDKTFRLFHRRQHILEHLLARRIIGDFAVSIDGIIGIVHEVAADFRIPSAVLDPLFHFGVLDQNARICPFRSKQQIQRNPADRQHENHNHPIELCAGLFVAVDDVEHKQQAEDIHRHQHRPARSIKRRHQQPVQYDLQQHQGYRKNDAVVNQRLIFPIFQNVFFYPLAASFVHAFHGRYSFLLR